MNSIKNTHLTLKPFISLNNEIFCSQKSDAFLKTNEAILRKVFYINAKQEKDTTLTFLLENNI